MEGPTIKTVHKADRRAAEKPVPLESAIVRSILRYLNGLPECRARKVAGSEKRAGEPDIDCVCKGRALKLEVKRPEPFGRKPTTLQAETMAAWHRAGAVTGVVRSLDDVKELLAGIG